MKKSKGCENREMVDIFIKEARHVVILEDALKAILLNTLHRNLDPMYKFGVLCNIKAAFGEEEYERLVDMYS